MNFYNEKIFYFLVEVMEQMQKGNCKSYVARTSRKPRPFEMEVFKQEMAAFLSDSDSDQECIAKPINSMTDQDQTIDRQAERTIKMVMAYLYCDEKSKDLKIVCENGKSVKAHSAIMANISPFVKDLLETAAKSETSDYITLNLQDYSQALVDAFVQKCYLIDRIASKIDSREMRSLCEDLCIDSIFIEGKTEGHKKTRRKRNTLTVLASDNFDIFSIDQADEADYFGDNIKQEPKVSWEETMEYDDESLAKSLSSCSKCRQPMSVTARDYYGVISGQRPPFECQECEHGIKPEMCTIPETYLIDLASEHRAEEDVTLSAQEMNCFDWKSIREPLDVLTIRQAPAVVQVQNQSRIKTASCMHCNSKISTSYRQHRRLLEHMNRSAHSVSKLNYVCKNCHKAGLSVPKTPTEKQRVEKWKKMAEPKRKLKRKRQEKCELCPHCGETFTAKAFRYHLNKEEGITPFKCTVEGCDVAAYSPANLRSHMYSKHNVGSKTPHKKQCDKCEQTVSNLQKHYAKYHDTQLKYGCDKCYYRFSNMIGLKSHLRQKHASDGSRHFACECGKTFIDKKSLHKHYQKTCFAHPVIEENLPIKCDECVARFRTPHALAIHNGREHSEKRFECAACGTKYSNKNLYMRHVGRCPANKDGAKANVSGLHETKDMSKDQENTVIHQPTTWIINPTTEYIQAPTQNIQILHHTSYFQTE